MINKTGFYICRALIGLCEGGFIPGTILFASYFYKSAELSVRLACFWSTLNIARVISALLAAGILNMRGIHNRPGWCKSLYHHPAIIADSRSLAVPSGRTFDFHHWSCQLLLLAPFAYTHQECYLPSRMAQRTRGNDYGQSYPQR